MNILIPHAWLLDQLDTKADPETIQRLVSLSGPSIERIYEKEGEPVYDVEVTTNRVDAMSIRGIAREIAVILNANDIEARLKPLELRHPSTPNADIALPLPKIENNPKLCPRIICIVLDKVEHTPTPEWMKKRLLQIDQREHDSVVDITNYVTHEYGHPIHAFDYDKIMRLGGVIRVVEAQPNEPFVTLDGVAFNTQGGEVVFENQSGEIIDLPAIKGTLNSAVDDTTTRVLLWIESLDAQKVRTASMKHAIRTVAAQLNEKNVDPNLAEVTLLKAIELYQKITHCQVASKMYDEYVQPPAKKPIFTSLLQIKAYLGITLSLKEVQSILTQLECKVDLQDDGVLVTPPSFRPDIELSVDVIEEIARIYGYQKLPSVLMPGVPPTQLPKDTNFDFEMRGKRLLAALGCQEVFTYSAVSESLAQASGFSVADHLKISNPLVEDHIYLRRSLLPSLHQIINSHDDHQQLTVFECANIYQPGEGTTLPQEILHVSLASRLTVPQVRAIIDRLLRDFFITIIEIKTSEDEIGQILAKGAFSKEIHIGDIRVEGNVVFVDLIWKEILKLASSHPHYHPLPKAAPLVEDLTFTLPEKTPIGQLITEVAAVSPLINRAELLGAYQQRRTIRITYQDQTNNLSSTEIAPIRQAIVHMVAKQWHGQLVGNLET